MKMDDISIIAAINAARDDALSAEESDVVSDRASALDRYYGRAYGDEVEGRSAVVSKDLADTVDWIMPSLMRIFAGGDTVVEFDPRGPEDEEQAAQETDYVNYIVTQRNPWPLVFHDFAKDGLLLRNGYAKAYWEDYKQPRYATYTGLDAEQVALVVKEATEVVEQREYAAEGGTLYDLKVREYEQGGRCCIEAVPPEELLVHRRCRGAIQTSPYVEHRPRKTRSDLIEMGLPKKFVEGVPSASSGDRSNEDAVARNVANEDEPSGSYTRAMDEVDYREVYIRLDTDGDGVAELRRIVLVGNQKVPGSEWDMEVDCIPFVSWTPNRMPHRHIGRSLADEVEDLARIKTTLLRATIDNAYINNNQRLVVNENVNLADLLVSRPGGLIRTKGIPGQDVVPLMATPILDKSLPLIEYIDGIKETRTGVGRASMGLDADTLKQSTKGAYMTAVSQASQKLEMIARMLAETGIKDLFLLVHGILLKNQDRPTVMRLRGNYVQVDPTTWSTRMDVSVSVGLGSGSAEERVMQANALAQAQMALAPMGLVGPEEAFATFEVLCKALGQRTPSKFAKDPTTDEFKQQMAQQQPQKDPLVQAKEIEVQGRMEAESGRAQAAKYAADQKAQVDRERMAVDAHRAEADRQTKEAIAGLDAQVKLIIARMDAHFGALSALHKMSNEVAQ